jgi:hypothetical protein
VSYDAFCALPLSEGRTTRPWSSPALEGRRTIPISSCAATCSSGWSPGRLRTCSHAFVREHREPGGRTVRRDSRAFRDAALNGPRASGRARAESPSTRSGRRPRRATRVLLLELVATAGGDDRGMRAIETEARAGATQGLMRGTTLPSDDRRTLWDARARTGDLREGARCRRSCRRRTPRGRLYRALGRRARRSRPRSAFSEPSSRRR